MRLNSLYSKLLAVIFITSLIAIGGTLTLIKNTIIDGFGDENPVMQTRDFALFEQIHIEFYQKHGGWEKLRGPGDFGKELGFEFKRRLYDLRLKYPEEFDRDRMRQSKRPPPGEGADLHRPPPGEGHPRGHRARHPDGPPPGRPMRHEGIEPPSDPDTLLGPLIGPGPDNRGPKGESGRYTANAMFPPPILLDEKMRWITGKTGPNLKMRHLKPLKLNGEVIGYLGFDFTHQTRFANMRLEQEQARIFPQILVGMGLLSLLLALPISYLLLKPIKNLTEGTRRVGRGEYDCTIESSGKDELGELSRRFNQMAADLQASRDSRQKFIADIAHEIRTPLSVIKSHLGAFADGMRKPTPEAFAKLDNRVNQLNRLIGDLYELSQFDVGALNYRKQQVCLLELLNDSIESFGDELTQSGLAIERDIEITAPLIVEADCERLSQVFGNLLTNAGRYTDSGGTVKISAALQGDKVLISIEDSAPGVKDDELPKIFEQLYRAPSNKARNTQGSGLGLALCKNIVAAHGGEIMAKHSALGGLKVSIELPVSQ